MAKTTKPTKQQIAQAKARAGGNNPVKVTNAGLKKLGNAALMAASFTPVGRVAKVAATVAKPIAAAARNAAGKKVVSATMGKAAAEKYATAAAKRTAQRTQTAADLKNAKTFASPSKASVQVKPARTASGPGLETRGARLTKAERAERAAELSFKKLEGRWEGEYLTRMTGLRGPKGITSQRTRGQGARSLRKEAAIKKEAKPVVKINSAVKAKTVNQARSSANATAKVTPSRKPIPNPANPPRGTVRINSGSNRPAMLRKRAVRAIPKKK